MEIRGNTPERRPVEGRSAAADRQAAASNRGRAETGNNQGSSGSEATEKDPARRSPQRRGDRVEISGQRAVPGAGTNPSESRQPEAREQAAEPAAPRTPPVVGSDRTPRLAGPLARRLYNAGQTAQPPVTPEVPEDSADGPQVSQPVAPQPETPPTAGDGRSEQDLRRLVRRLYNAVKDQQEGAGNGAGPQIPEGRDDLSEQDLRRLARRLYNALEGSPSNQEPINPPGLQVSPEEPEVSQPVAADPEGGDLPRIGPDEANGNGGDAPEAPRPDREVRPLLKRLLNRILPQPGAQAPVVDRNPGLTPIAQRPESSVGLPGSPTESGAGDRVVVSNGADRLSRLANALRAERPDPVSPERLAELRSAYREGRLNTMELIVKSADRLLAGEPPETNVSGRR